MRSLDWITRVQLKLSQTIGSKIYKIISKMEKFLLYLCVKFDLCQTLNFSTYIHTYMSR